MQLVQAYREATTLDERLAVGEELIQKIAPEIQMFLFSATPNYATSADLAQETLVAIARGLSRFQGESPAQFWSWAYRIARNKTADHLKRKAIDAQRFERMPAEELWELADSGPGESALSPEDRHDLEEALSLLARSKPDCRELLWKHYVIGLDYTELAEEGRVSYDTSRMKVSRCMATAQALMANHR